MRILPDVEKSIRRTIRDERAKDPIISVVELQGKLERHFNRTFKHHYVKRLADKVARETLVELDRTKIEQRIATTRENYRMMREALLKIIYWSPDTAETWERPPRKADIVEAAKTVAMLDLALLKVEVEAGMYSRQTPEELAKTIHYEPLAPEVRGVIIAAWVRGGLLPKPAVEQMVPAIIDANAGAATA